MRKIQDLRLLGQYPRLPARSRTSCYLLGPFQRHLIMCLLHYFSTGALPHSNPQSNLLQLPAHCPRECFPQGRHPRQLRGPGLLQSPTSLSPPSRLDPELSLGHASEATLAGYLVNK